METNISTKELANKVMKGLSIAVKKVIEDARKNNQSLVVSVNGKIEYITPKAES